MMSTQQLGHDREGSSGGWFDAFFRRVLFAKDIVITAPKVKHANTGDVLRLYGDSLRQYPLTIILILTGVLAASVTGVFIPLFYKDFFDLLAQGSVAGSGHALRNVVLVILGLNLIAFMGWRTTNFTNQYLAARVMGDLRTRAFAYLIDHSQRFFTGTFTGTLVQRVNRFANAYDRLADKIIYDIVPIVVNVTGVVWILLGERPIIALVILIWAGLFIACNYVFAQWKLKYDIASAEQDSKTTGVLADIITNQPTVDAHGSHAFEKLRYNTQVRRQMHMNRFRWNLGETMETIQALLIVLVEFAVFYIGVSLWEKGQFSIGMFVLVQAYIIRLSGQLWSFSRIIRDVYESFADGKEMAEIMLIPHEITEMADAQMITEAKGEVRFEHVSFGYQSGGIVNDFSAVIKAGGRVALVGPSGAGKSTIVKLLFRFYDPSKGVIRIDGTPIQKLAITSLRQVLSLVPQDPILFHRSLMENIRYGRPEATDTEVIAAAKLAHCDEFTETLPAKYETLVGERGIKLSGGERQRVALARAFLRNAPIIVLDEATSSLDSESEGHIQDALSHLMKGRTTLVIAHRLSTIRSMDRIIVMDGGAIIEDGAHDALLEKKGVYWKLWTLQQNGFIPGDVVPSEA